MEDDGWHIARLVLPSSIFHHRCKLAKRLCLGLREQIEIGAA